MAATPRISSYATVTVCLKPLVGGSTEFRKTAQGLELAVSESQFRFITVCLDVARKYNDEHLEFLVKKARDNEGLFNRWLRDPILAANANREEDEIFQRLKISIDAHKAAKAIHACAFGL